MKRISKQLLLITLILSFLGFWAPASYATEELEIYYNLQEIVFDQSPFIENGRTLVPTFNTNSISVLTEENEKVTLGMDVTEMQEILDSPQFVWGRGNPAPTLNYSYSNEGIVCCLGKTVIISIGPESSFKTADGISIGDSLKVLCKHIL